jgi:hypothetical protein
VLREHISLAHLSTGKTKANNREDENKDGKTKKSEIARDRNPSTKMIKADRKLKT